MKEQIEKLVSAVKDGETNPLEAYVSLRAVKHVLEEALSQLKDDVIEEHSKHGEKEVNIKGAKVSITSGGRYSYKSSSQWAELNDKRKSIEKSMQMAYKTGEEMYDSDGVLIEPAEYIPNNESVKVEWEKH